MKTGIIQWFIRLSVSQNSVYLRVASSLKVNVSIVAGKLVPEGESERPGCVLCSQSCSCRAFPPTSMSAPRNHGDTVEVTVCDPTEAYCCASAPGYFTLNHP